MQDLITPEKHLFIGLSETWLQSHLDAELTIEGYTIFRCDSARRKKSSRGRLTGGAALYVRNDIACSCEIITSYFSSAVQALCIHSKTENIAIAVIYRQPDNSSNGYPSTPSDFRTALSHLKSAMADLSPVPDFIFGGDFNLPHAVWPTGTTGPGATKDEKNMIHTLNEFSNELFLTEIVEGPTHKDGNTLDLVFTNNIDLVHHWSTIPVLQSTSHHSAIQVATTYKTFSALEDVPPPPLTGFNSLNFHSEDVDWTAVNKELSEIDWQDSSGDLSPEHMLEFFYNKCLSITSKHVPPKKKTKASKYSKVHRYRRSLTNRRRRINQRLLKITSPATQRKLQKELLEIEKNLQRSHQGSATHIEEKAVEAIRSNSKFFFAYAKKKSKVKTNIGPLLDENNKLTSNSKIMAEILSKQYSKVFSTPTENLPNNHPRTSTQETQSCLHTISFTEEDITSAINEISPTAAAGPDGFPAILLKNCKEALAVPITILWKKCFVEGTIPHSLKQSMIAPHHKGNSKADAVNYRPIALTSHIIKIFEKVIRTHLVAHLEHNNLFNPNQHGFRAGRSCLSQLLDHFDNLLDILQTGANADVIYLDYSKAFDKVDFNIVLAKLLDLGICGNVYDWIEAFLTDRKQFVTVNGCVSDPKPVISGVPQGSVLGPLIFLILVGDIDNNISQDTKVRSFADDTRATRGVATVADTICLQEDLNRIYNWTENVNMKLNDDKFEVLRYGTNNELKESTTYTTPKGLPIEAKTEVKDLGVVMSDDNKFNKQIDQVITKAKNMASWILRTFRTRARVPMLTLYKSLVLPILEYCSVLWCPLSVGNKQKIEAVQWSFLRKITGTRNMNYWQTLHELKIYSLERRRERYRIIYMWKILEGLVPNINNNGVQSYENPRQGRKCITPTLNKTKDQSFTSHAPRLYNALPRSVRNAAAISVDSFKRVLDRWLTLVPDEPQIPNYTQCRRAPSNSILDMSKLEPNSESLISIEPGTPANVNEQARGSYHNMAS